MLQFYGIAFYNFAAIIKFNDNLKIRVCAW